MSAARPTNRRPATAQSLGLGIGTALVIHTAVLAGSAWLGVGLGAGGAFAGTHKPDEALAELAPLEPSCGGDVILTAAARATLCLSPWADPDACLPDVATQLALEHEDCKHQADAVEVSVITMSKEEIERIDPEPLLEILAAAEQMKFEQQQQQQQQQQAQAEQQRQQQMAQKNAQVIETAKPTVEVAPDTARFLAEHDTKVERETVARGSRDEPMVAKSRPDSLPVKKNAREPSAAEPPPDRAPGKNPDAPDLPGKLSMRAPGAISPARAAEEAKIRGMINGSMAPLADGMTAKKGDGAIEREKREVDPNRGQGGAGGGVPPVPKLRPSEDVLERALGGGSVDHLEQVDSGDETALNAKRWVYASFFNRLKRQVAQNWEPAQVWRRHDPTGAVYGYKTRVTTLRVTIDKAGKMAKPPTVVHASGVDVLDDEASRAFMAAAPFPNPPSGLLKGDGKITFEFSFHFEIGAPRTSWRVLRSM